MEVRRAEHPINYLIFMQRRSVDIVYEILRRVQARNQHNNRIPVIPRQAKTGVLAHQHV